MAQVTLRINGYAYTLGCQDGEEKHLDAMGAEVGQRIDGVRTAVRTQRRGSDAGDGGAADGRRHF